MSSVTFLVIFFYNGSLIFLHNLHIISKFFKNIRTICFSRQNIKDTIIFLKRELVHSLQGGTCRRKKLLPIGFEPMISTLLVWRLTNLAIEARTCWFSTLHQAILFIQDDGHSDSDGPLQPALRHFVLDCFYNLQVACAYPELS